MVARGDHLLNLRARVCRLLAPERNLNRIARRVLDGDRPLRRLRPILQHDWHERVHRLDDARDVDERAKFAVLHVGDGGDAPVHLRDGVGPSILCALLHERGSLEPNLVVAVQVVELLPLWLQGALGDDVHLSHLDDRIPAIRRIVEARRANLAAVGVEKVEGEYLALTARVGPASHFLLFRHTRLDGPPILEGVERPDGHDARRRLVARRRTTLPVVRVPSRRLRLLLLLLIHAATIVVGIRRHASTAVRIRRLVGRRASTVRVHASIRVRRLLLLLLWRSVVVPSVTSIGIFTSSSAAATTNDGPIM
mmetsp:Transcript_9861/g.26382  ORF Transcript_9861/g.26382 Transcript_9861/m.26382 type:complete len:309 (-) Transcript_9861:5-931(-)